MFMSLLSHLLSACFCFALPSYYTFKAIQQGPVADRDLQRWAMYWSVVGLFISFENVAEWFISWLPFYWEIKTAFLLFLALPQTEGSTYIYTTHLAPYLSKNEANIDANITQIQSNILEFFVSQFEGLAGKALGVLGIQYPPKQGETAGPGAMLSQFASLLHTFAGATHSQNLQRPPASTSSSSSSIQSDYSAVSASSFQPPAGFVPT